MKYIAVLLTVFNRKEQTLKCLKDLYAQALPEGMKMHVYLTDDGCTDGTPEVVKERFPQVNVIHGDGTLFWNRGMWTAWSAAATNRDYNYFLWLNDDTTTYPYMIKELLKVSVNKNDKAIIVGPTVDTKGNKIHTYGGRIGKSLAPLEGQLYRCETFNGNIVLIPSGVFNILDFNDFYFRHSLGDLDYGMRATEAGIEIWQLGIPVGECDRHERIMQWCDPEVSFFKRWEAFFQPTGYPPKEVFYFNQKHYGVIKAIICTITAFVRCLIPTLWIKINKSNWT
jgi:GT2 family glycosyltransferase